jgi:DNA-binding PucR family transcriptional regulator
LQETCSSKGTDTETQSRAFEKVYAVFDRDDHPSYFDALRLAESFAGKLKNDAKQFANFEAIASVPSFELWLLLHYEDIQAPLHRDEVMHRLKRYIPSYDKGARGTFESTQKFLDVASERAEALAGKNSADTEPEPYTAIYKLVTLLTTLGV